MCNHYRLKDDIAVVEFAAQHSLDYAYEDPKDRLGEPWTPVNEARPWDGVPLPVVYPSEAGSTFGHMRWGVWPFYNRDRPKNFATTCNARDDALLTKPIWKLLAAHGRCLVPADGFYEWTGPVGAKHEVLFHMPDEDPFFFAGIWSRDPVGGGRGFAIVTCRPNPLLAAVPHDRMPVILDLDAARAWIGREPLPDAELLALCRPYPGDLVRVDLPRPEGKPGKLRREDLESGELPIE